MVHKEIQSSFPVSRVYLGLLLKRCRGKGPSLLLRGESCGFSQVAFGSLGCLSNCGRDLRKPVMLPQGSEVSFRVARGKAGLLSSHCRGMGSHLALMGETRGVSLVAAGSFEFLLICNGEFREPLVLPQGSRASFLIARGTSGFFSSRCRGIGPHLDLMQVTQGSSLVVKEILGFLLSLIRGVRH